MPSIKKIVKMNLTELIDWIWKNEVEDKRFISDCVKSKVFVSKYGKITTACGIGKTDTFTVEVEEEITEYKKIWKLIELSSEGLLGRTYLHKNLAIEDVKTDNSVAFYIIDDDLTPTLIWKKGELVD